MEALIKLVSDKTGISTEQATTAVNTVVGFLKDKLPAGIGAQIESYAKGGSPDLGNITDSLKDKMGGLFK